MTKYREILRLKSLGFSERMHTATPSGRFCGRKWTRSEASGQFS